MRNSLTAGLAALAISLSPGTESSAKKPSNPGLYNDGTKRDADGCPEGERAVEAAIKLKYPKLTARACLGNEFKTIEELREKCSGELKTLAARSKGGAAPFWDCVE